MRYLKYLTLFFLFCNCNEGKDDRYFKLKSENKGIELYNIESILLLKSFDELNTRFGKGNIQIEFVDICDDCGPEGSSNDVPYYITTVFPNSNKEIIIDWNFEKNQIQMITINKTNSPWQTKHKLKIGDNISKLYNLNIADSLFYFNVFQFKFEKDYLIMLDGNLNFSPSDFDNYSINDRRLKNLEIISFTMFNPTIKNAENNNLGLNENNFEESENSTGSESEFSGIKCKHIHGCYVSTKKDDNPVTQIREKRQYSGEWVSKCKNGIVTSMYSLKNGNGEWKEWYKNGNLRTLSAIQDCEWTGVAKTWYPNGQIAKIKIYDLGSSFGEGKHEYYSIDGTLLRTEWCTSKRVFYNGHWFVDADIIKSEPHIPPYKWEDIQKDMATLLGQDQ